MMLLDLRPGGGCCMHNLRGRIRSLRRDEWGALEGLPLYLIILVTITAIALVVIIALLPRPLVPTSMTTDVTVGPGKDVDWLCWDSTPATQTPQAVVITVYTRDNVPINDVTVHLSGAAAIDRIQKTAGGNTNFTNIITASSSNPGSATVNVEATFGGVTIP